MLPKPEESILRQQCGGVRSKRVLTRQAEHAEDSAAPVSSDVRVSIAEVDSVLIGSDDEGDEDDALIMTAKLMGQEISQHR